MKAKVAERGQVTIPKALRKRLGLNRFWLQQSDDLQHFRNLYMGEVSYLDDQFGVLMAKLRELGIYEDCMIVAVADHGESLGEHDIQLNHYGLYQVTVQNRDHLARIIKRLRKLPNVMSIQRI